MQKIQQGTFIADKHLSKMAGYKMDKKNSVAFIYLNDKKTEN